MSLCKKEDIVKIREQVFTKALFDFYVLTYDSQDIIVIEDRFDEHFDHLGLKLKSVTNDAEAVLKYINHYFAKLKVDLNTVKTPTLCLDTNKLFDGVFLENGEKAIFFIYCEEDLDIACEKILKSLNLT